MVTRSAGLLLFRRTTSGTLEVLLGHMGGPFWSGKDAAAWSIPKGLHGDDEDPVAAAHREFAEELGHPAPPGTAHRLGTVRQPSGKHVTAFAVEGDLDPATTVSNTFALEWPPGSGRVEDYPEIDRAAWFDLATARRKLVRGQVPFLDRLVDAVGQQ